VWTPKGNVCFHHLPSGTLANPGANILIGAGAVINVNSFLEEVAEFNVEHRLSIDPNAIIIDNDDIKYEKALVSSIGSTGQGVGRATSRKILRTAASPDVVLAKDHPKLKPFITPIQVLLGSAYYHGHKVLLEGTQGTSLSIHHGHYPYVTSRDTTASGTLSDAGIPPHRVNKVIMVCRTHPIRVKSPEGSTSGPMEQEIDLQHVARNTGIDVAVLEKTETTSTTKLRRRIAEFDWVQLHKSCQLNGPTDIALTFVDYIDKNNAGARRLSDLSMDTIRFIETIEIATGVPVSLISTMFHREGVIDLRKW
jgi:adenylosuccinate synthase